VGLTAEPYTAKGNKSIRADGIFAGVWGGNECARKMFFYPGGLIVLMTASFAHGQDSDATARAADLAAQAAQRYQEGDVQGQSTCSTRP